MKDQILSARELCRSFAHNGGQIHVLSHINMDLYQGDFTVIMGPSGAGKSTLLKIIMGIEQPTDGKMEMHGQVYCPQSPIEANKNGRSEERRVGKECRL